MNQVIKKEVRIRKMMSTSRNSKTVTANSMYLTKQKPASIIRLDAGRPSF